MSDDLGGKRASETLARYVRDFRKRKGWSQEELAARLRELDLPLDRSQVARIEKRERKVSIDEAFALAAALGVAPVHLFIPIDVGAGFVVSDRCQMSAADARAWMRGDLPVGDVEDERAYWTQRPDDEFRALVGLHTASHLRR